MRPAALKRLIKTCDVFAVTVRYAGLERLGLGLRVGEGDPAGHRLCATAPATARRAPTPASLPTMT